MDDINIQNEDLMEFEFVMFSIFFDPSRNTWFLEAYEEELDIVLNEETINQNKEVLETIGFDIDDLDNLKNFVKEMHNENNL